MKTFNKALYFPLLFLFLLFNLSNSASAANIPFTSVKIDSNSSIDSVTIRGAILTIGNQLLCRNANDDDGSEGADGDTCLAPTEGTPNNSWYQYKTKIDTDASAPYNSMAKLVLLPGDEIIFARLYWSARASNITDAESVAARQIKIKGPLETTYTQITADAADHGSDIAWNDYAASVDVTQYVKDNGAGNYYVGDIVSDTGGTGLYASWQLAVVVKNASRSLKNIAIYDGYDSIFGTEFSPETITVDATGFITPTGTEPFNANLFVYAGETDDSYGDSSKIKDGSDVWHSLVDGQNDVNDVMNASVSSPDYTDGYRSKDAGMADPNFRNVLGVDIDKLVINDKLDTTQQFLSNSQTSTQIELSSSGDRYSLIMFAFETEVYVPEFCYDYAYTQQGKYFTESNDGNQSPRLTGDVIPGEPIEVTIFLKSLVDSSIGIQNMELHVDDINTSQAEYIPNTPDDDLTNATKVAKIDDLYPIKVSVNAGTAAGMDYIHDIPIGILNQNEYFYAYYSLDPQTDTLDMPINVTATYQLVLSTTSVDYDLILSKEIPLCSTSNFEYTPAKGIFNVAHNDYYTYDQSSGGTKYYNLPTQVTKREGDFKVLAMDPDNFDELLFDHPPTIVAVEMIDAGAFHFTEASCREMASSISKRVWVIIDQNTTSVSFNKAALQAAIDSGMTYLTDTTEFYTMARQNAAFRITYNSMDGNDTLPYLAKQNNGSWDLLNWQSTWTGAECNQDMVTNGLGNDNAVASYCNLTGGSPDSVALCMECLYGLNTKFVCSRDNFAIRPEAFILNIDDQNQTDQSLQIRLTSGYSGVTGATAPVINLAAYYDYNLEINATNHINNQASNGYTRSFNSAYPNDTAEYTWDDRVPFVTLNACNDESNQTINSSGGIRFLNGVVDVNSSVPEVGEYLLNIKDTTWSAVDSDTNFMTHHTGSHFASGLDCTANDSSVQTINSATLNGCEITSSHTNADTSVVYNDYAITFHPYRFNTTNTVTLGKGDISAAATGFKPFVYMSNLSQDENMSVHLNTTVSAVGKNSTVPLSNYVTGCYSKPLNFTIGKSATTNNTLSYNYVVHNRDSNGTIIPAHDINQSIAAGNLDQNVTFATSSLFFQQDQNGTIQLRTNLNYARDVNRTSNPEDINFTTISLDDNATFFYADLLANKFAEGNVSVNQRVLHYYGRTIAPRIRVVCNQKPCRTGPHFSNDNSIQELISYVVFCEGGTCNSSILPVGATQVGGIEWFSNINHDKNNTITWLADGTDGTIGTITEVTNSGNVNELNQNITSTKYETEVVIEYDGPLPYDAIMQMQSSPWLIHHETNNNATANEFIIHFVGDGGWSGRHEDNTTTETKFSPKTNRRIMW